MRAPKTIILTTLICCFLLLSSCDMIDEILGLDSPSDPMPNPPSSEQSYQPQLVGFDAILEITDFVCINAEEDDFVTSSGQDEITFIYTLIQTDPNGYAVRSVSYAWGPYDIYRGDHYTTDYFEDLRINDIPVGHGVISTMTIVEIEDYDEAQQVMDTINKYARYVEYANYFNPEPDSKAAIEIITEILEYSGYALDLVDWADDDDLLADHITFATPNIVYNELVNVGYLYDGRTFFGSNNMDNFEYEVHHYIHLFGKYE